MYSRVVNAFSATKAGSWVVRHVAARVDPTLFRWSRGRVTTTGRPTLPMLTLTTTGRRTLRPRPVQLAHLAERSGTWLVVASAMGQDTDPDWLLNLRADPRARVLLPGRELEVLATVLDADEKAAAWPDLVRTVPQLRTYVSRTTRDIPVVRLTPRSRP
ncbi:MAG: nitroreductase/quinone reductase family protein [Ornithinibacter sp.]